MEYWKNDITGAVMVLSGTGISGGPGYTLITDPVELTNAYNDSVREGTLTPAERAADEAIRLTFAAALVSAHAKFVALGLSSFEATALTGYDPDDDFGDGPGDGDFDGDA